MSNVKGLLAMSSCAPGLSDNVSCPVYCLKGGEEEKPELDDLVAVRIILTRIYAPDIDQLFQCQSLLATKALILILETRQQAELKEAEQGEVERERGLEQEDSVNGSRGRERE